MTRRPTTRLRTNLIKAIERAELLPVWFDTVLGMAPPADADAWLRVGTNLLAYRATYGITDPVVALGPQTDAHSSKRRSQWHRKLTNELRAYH